MTQERADLAPETTTAEHSKSSRLSDLPLPCWEVSPLFTSSGFKDGYHVPTANDLRSRHIRGMDEPDPLRSIMSCQHQTIILYLDEMHSAL